MKATAKVGACTHLGCKGQKSCGNRSTLQFCDVGGVWPVAIGHRHAMAAAEEGIGFRRKASISLPSSKTRRRVHKNRTPSLQKKGSNVSAGAIGLLGGAWLGWLPGSQRVMAVRELGRQQREDNADSRGRITVNRRNLYKAASCGATADGRVAVCQSCGFARKPPRQFRDRWGCLWRSTLCVGCQACVTKCQDINFPERNPQGERTRVEQRQTVAVYQ